MPERLSDPVHSIVKALLGWVVSKGIKEVTGAVLSIPNRHAALPAQFPARSYAWMKTAASFPSGCPVGLNGMLHPLEPSRSVPKFTQPPDNQSTGCQKNSTRLTPRLTSETFAVNVVSESGR